MNAPAHFASTIWSVVHSAGENRQTAYAELMGAYRTPVVRYLRGRGVDVETAEDLAQEVFLRLFHKSLLEKIAASKGKFRSYLLGVTNNILREHRERAGAARRGGGAKAVTLEPSRFEAPAEEREDFDREWMLHLVRLAVKRIQESSSDAGKRDLGIFLEHLRERPSYEELARRFRATTTTVKNAVQGIRKRIRHEVARLVAMYAYSDGEFEEEMTAFERQGLRSAGRA